MKKRMLCISLVTLVFLGFRLATTDYRDAYVGSYFCNSNCQKQTPEGINNTADTTTISVSKDALDSILQMTVNGSTVKVKLVTDTMVSYPTGGRAGGAFYSTDSIAFGIAYGRSTVCNFSGKKR